MLNLWDNIKVAMSAIRMNMLRAVLTMLIIGLGIMALISMLTAVDGMKTALYSNFAAMGSNTFTISEMSDLARFSGSHRGGKEDLKPITLRQAEEFQRRYNTQADISISYTASGAAVLKVGDSKTPPKITVKGADEHFLSASGLTLEEGRNFTAQERQYGARAVILGNKLRSDLFGERNAVGQDIRIGSHQYIVIGYLKAKGSSFGSSQDDMAIIPLPAAQNTFSSENERYQIAVQV
ncbi:MAG: ABC transporter permease, partial [Bacteroidota bacterium]|nr:ABC transporter permease [Bacteroidota bacterium]